ncbi:MAG: NAD-dependent epimerase/dehydratase family protein [Rhizobiales bacterium]|nr:NAD-dependent epimerase/dehydratase family protein [Hyphomicrobiales bacterium]
MADRIFLAGATGVVGRRLIPLLREAGHEVWGTTRRAEKGDELAKAGAHPVIVDVFDADALSAAVLSARPHVVIHQLTDLPPKLDPAGMEAALPRNARIRDEGTRNLIAAALAAGARRLIAQSIAWTYAPGPEPHGEDDPLKAAAEGPSGVTMRGVISLEEQVLNAAPMEGIVLRYGELYGPRTGSDAPQGTSPLHVDAAAHAALLAIDHGRPGAYNIAEPNAAIATGKAAAELGWRPDFRLPAAAGD